MKKKVAILVFPGTNCEQDLKSVLERSFNFEVELLWHNESFFDKYDFYFLPGGFSYGDYLRSGALAAKSVSLKSLVQVANNNKPILGICNGFQILTECGLLPGALIKNKTLKHIAKWVKLETSKELDLPSEMFMPVSHSDGNYTCNEETLNQLQNQDQVILRYQEDINGSIDKIAGIKTINNKIFGLMPHPERAINPQYDYAHSNKAYGFEFLKKVFEVAKL